MAAVATSPQVPPTRKTPVTDEYHGVTVVDDYRWLEDFSDSAVRSWNDEQNRYTRAVLDAIPARESIYGRLEELYTATSADYFALKYRGGTLFAIKSQPPKEQPYLVTLKSADDPGSEHVILDPNQLNPSGTTTIDFYEPSLDGRLVAVSLSEKGSEEGTLHVYEVATGAELGDLIPRVTYPTAGGSVAWNADGTGFYYTRYPRGDERPPEDLNFYQQVYFHRLGTPIEVDTYVIGQDFPRIAEIELDTSHDGRYLLATVANGDGGEYAHYLLNPSGEWTQLTRFADQITHAEFGEDEALYLLSLRGTPRGSVLRVALASPDVSQAQTVVTERDATIQRFTPAATRLYMVEMIGGPSQIRVFDLAGDNDAPLPAEPVSSVGQVLRLEGDEILFRSGSFIAPPAWYRFDPAEEEPVRTALFVTSPADFGDTEVVREFATSKDGTRIPLNIIRRKDARLDGNHPTILYGYGGYGISLSPSFSVRRRLWLDHGGVYVIANLRGGDEYGEEWHKAGNLTRKQNVFDDFVACAEYLIQAGYTNPNRLAIEGGSNGGLLMGASLTQRPELFRAVVAYVGVFDMLRVELDPNGAFNVTEFGTVADLDQFKALYVYSPYHRIVDGTTYPAVLIVTGENDGRVSPANSRKMAARLQAATCSGLPVLLRTSASSGHGIGTSLHERIAQDADVFAFLFDQLGVNY
ncbi:MAG: prolyl oligopeptidase family serine peptidase [Chloroflexota bacterium]|nr:prolyl oligopeptidase family serine peptidase [Chloroflexota bacterium]